MGYVFILLGIIGLILNTVKPSFYWNSRRVMRVRRMFGDGASTVVNYLTSLLVIILGTLLLLGKL